jgi:hypothetical protein
MNDALVNPADAIEDYATMAAGASTPEQSVYWGAAAMGAKHGFGLIRCLDAPAAYEQLQDLITVHLARADACKSAGDALGNALNRGLAAGYGTAAWI